VADARGFRVRGWGFEERKTHCRAGQAPPLRLGTRSLLRDDDGGRGENGAELAGGERVQGTKAAFEFDRSQATQAKEGAQKIFGGRFSLLRVALDAAGNEIAVGIAASAGLRDNMVEHSPTSDEPPQAIKAQAALARMNGLAPTAHLQEIHLLEVGAAGPPSEAGGHRSRAARRVSPRVERLRPGGQPGCGQPSAAHPWQQDCARRGERAGPRGERYGRAKRLKNGAGACLRGGYAAGDGRRPRAR